MIQNFSTIKKMSASFPIIKAVSSIKKELKQKFPGIKFSVKSSRSSIGNSVDIFWEFGPTHKEVDDIVDKYRKSSFDEMQDLYVNDTNSEKRKFQEEHGFVKYVYTHRLFKTPNRMDWFENSIYGQIGKDLCAKQGVEYKGETTKGLYGPSDSQYLEDHVRHILSQSSFPPGWTYKGIIFKNGEYFLVGANNAPASVSQEKEYISEEDVSEEEKYLNSLYGQ